MSLEKEYVLTIQNKESLLNEQLFISQHEKGIDILFKIIDSPSLKVSKHKYMYSDIVLIDTFGNEIVGDITPVVENRVLFTLTNEIIGNMSNFGKYNVYIRLYNDRGISTILPPFPMTYEESPVSEKTLALGEVNTSEVDNCKIFKLGKEISIYNADGTYNLKIWVAGDIITDSKLNQIEQAIYDLINHKIETDKKLKELDKSKGYIIKVGTDDFPVIIEDLKKGTYLIEGSIQDFNEGVPYELEGKNYLYVTYASEQYLKVVRCFNEEVFKLYKYDRTTKKIIPVGEEVKVITPVDDVLTLTEDRNQLSTLSAATTIALPSIETFSKITLYLNVLSSTTMTFPKVIWLNEPNVDNDGLLEINFTYANGKWYAKSEIYEG